MRNVRLSSMSLIIAGALSASAAACSKSAPPMSPSALTSQTATARSTAGGAADADTAPLPASADWTLESPANVPASSCISVNDIDGGTLDWTVQPTPGHPSGFVVQPLFFHKETANCDDVDQQTPRRLEIIGHSEFAPGEEAPSTLRWFADRCKDGGRFEIDVLVKRNVPSETDSDRESTQLIVNCGFDSPVPGL